MELFTIFKRIIKRASGRPLLVAFNFEIEVKPAEGEGGWGAEGGGEEEGLLVVAGAGVTLLLLRLVLSKGLSLARERRDLLGEEAAVVVKMSPKGRRKLRRMRSAFYERDSYGLK